MFHALNKMEIKVLDEKKNKLVIEIKGADHTLCNVLKTELLNDKHIKIATYGIRHPMISSPQMTVETDGEATPRSVLSSAVTRLHKVNEKFLNSFKAEVK